MGVNDTTKIVLGSLRYKASPNTVLSVNVDLNQNKIINLHLLHLTHFVICLTSALYKF